MQCIWVLKVLEKGIISGGKTPSIREAISRTRRAFVHRVFMLIKALHLGVYSCCCCLIVVQAGRSILNQFPIRSKELLVS